MGMVFQSNALWPHMTVRKNVAFGLEERHVVRREIRERVNKALDLVGLLALADRRPSQLSGGQQQRVKGDVGSKATWQENIKGVGLLY